MSECKHETLMQELLCACTGIDLAQQELSKIRLNCRECGKWFKLTYTPRTITEAQHVV